MRTACLVIFAITSLSPISSILRSNPQTVDVARAMLDSRKPRKPDPPPQLSPEAMALAVFDNGDERNEWE